MQRPPGKGSIYFNFSSNNKRHQHLYLSKQTHVIRETAWKIVLRRLIGPFYSSFWLQLLISPMEAWTFLNAKETSFIAVSIENQTLNNHSIKYRKRGFMLFEL